MGVPAVIVVLAVLLPLQQAFGQTTDQAEDFPTSISLQQVVEGPFSDRQAVAEGQGRQLPGQPSVETTADSCRPSTKERFVCTKETGTSQLDQVQANLTQLQGQVDLLRTDKAKQDARIAELTDKQVDLEKQVGNLTKLRHVQQGCPSGYVQFQNRCFNFSTESKNYNDARLSCKAAGGHLAMPKDNATNAFLVEQINVMYPNGSSGSVWFGLADREEEGSFVWEDGTPLGTGWNNWNQGEPNNQHSREDCVEWRAKYGYKWNDVRCFTVHKYVCEVDAGSP
ncbi:CD209 antigen-like protein C [Branchiostoma floridae]|uniref:CD209 antigen-like protein C n=1 Tax=Branchiostoma floridae TaxID=7739 RepID=C3ZT95_BRAFL|nr:CD209 antigen-like protein C [Branchiostoma floridae]|eukprot:XP_002588290.1 hypothetical protein BRAFLDRAFT_86739 [Branchiostoma floridae]